MFEIISTIKPEIFIQGGAVLVALYLIYSHILKDKSFIKLISNHLEHEQESRDKLTKALEQLSNKIDNLK